MSFSLNKVISNGATQQNDQNNQIVTSVRTEESSTFGNLLANAISRCFADSIASYKEKQEAAKPVESCGDG